MMAAAARTTPGVEISTPAWVDDDTREYRDQVQIAADLDELREENDALRVQLAKAHQLLRTIKRIDPKPVGSKLTPLPIIIQT